MKVPSEYLEQWLEAPTSGPGFCLRCGFTGPAVTRCRGSTRLESGLWSLLVVVSFGYAAAAVIDHFLPVFPGVIVRLLSLLAKLVLGLVVVYTVYRLNSRAPCCPNCGRSALIPPESPRARQRQRDAAQ
ncbi:hypothetical protein HQ590_05500 [bacterium]|nr:hypothetical protein [bacterium]